MAPILGALLAAVLLVGCTGRGTASPEPGPGVRLLVFGAASLARSLEDVRTAYRAVDPAVTIDLATDSSAALATQILQGAPADVFLSADTASPARLEEAGLTAAEPVRFASNGLILVVPANDPTVTTPMDLARPGLQIIAAGDAVPISRYAKELVDNLAREPGYPADFAAAYAANVVSREDNVQAVAAKIALGEGEAGIVYRTDAFDAPALRAIEVPDTSAVRADYAGVVIAGSAHREAATAFLGWLVGPGGQAVLSRSGFLPAGP